IPFDDGLRVVVAIAPQRVGVQVPLPPLRTGRLGRCNNPAGGSTGNDSRRQNQRDPEQGQTHRAPRSSASRIMRDVERGTVHVGTQVTYGAATDASTSS